MTDQELMRREQQAFWLFHAMSQSRLYAAQAIAAHIIGQEQQSWWMLLRSEEERHIARDLLQKMIRRESTTKAGAADADSRP